MKFLNVLSLVVSFVLSVTSLCLSIITLKKVKSYDRSYHTKMCDIRNDIYLTNNVVSDIRSKVDFYILPEYKEEDFKEVSKTEFNIYGGNIIIEALSTDDKGKSIRVGETTLHNVSNLGGVYLYKRKKEY